MMPEDSIPLQKRNHPVALEWWIKLESNNPSAFQHAVEIANNNPVGDFLYWNPRRPNRSKVEKGRQR